MRQSKLLIAMALSVTFSSSSCSMLTDLMGNLGGGGGGATAPELTPSDNPTFVELADTSLSLSGGNASSKIGYVAASSSPSDPKADGGYLYGIFSAK